MRFTPLLRGALLLPLFLALPARAAAQETPEEVALAYFEHFKEGRLAELTALTHPRALAWFKNALITALEQDSADAADLDVDALRVLPPDSVYLRMLNAAPEGNRLGALMVDMRMEPLGHLAQGDSLAHVVYVGRGNLMGAEAAQTMAVTLRRHQDRWLVDPGDGLLGMLGTSVMYLLIAATMEGRTTGAARARP
ncbi:MAG: hypothetical protein KY467_18420 [Gemmatimonadetes bacterium]|nr:hypothetical protein [Gemmatimonadota bacterium]